MRPQNNKTMKLQVIYPSIVNQGIRLHNTRIAPNRFALLHVCRQAHSKTALLPFSLNKFRFHTLQTFLDIGKRLSAEQRGAIRSVHLQTWGRDMMDIDNYLAAMGRRGESFEDICPHVEELVVEVMPIRDNLKLIMPMIVRLKAWVDGQK
jgi:hypothetical protein